jgi:hypothetical protein
VAFGEACGLRESRLQYKPLKDPRSGVRREAWHWDLGGPVYPPADERLYRSAGGGATNSGIATGATDDHGM